MGSLTLAAYFWQWYFAICLIFGKMAVAESAGSGIRARGVLEPWASYLTLLSLFSVNNTMCSLGMFHIEDQIT